MQKFAEKKLNAHDKFYIEADVSNVGYKQFMRSELQRTVSALCDAVQQERPEPQAPLAAPFVSASVVAANKQTAGAIDQEAKQVLQRRKTKWPLLRRTVYSNGISF